MTNRREFLQTGAAVSALPLAINGLLAPDAAVARVAANDVRVHTALFDDRYPQCVAFAQEMGRFGIATRALPNGDITEFWYDVLDPLWRGERVAIAGTTQFGPMFALERLANDRGMRVALRIEHRPLAAGGLAHVVAGPPEAIAIVTHLQAQGVGWPALAAAALTHCRGDCVTPATHTLVAAGEAPAPALHANARSADGPPSIIHYYTPLAIQRGEPVPFDGPLFSWLIAPRVRS